MSYCFSTVITITISQKLRNFAISYGVERPMLAFKNVIMLTTQFRKSCFIYPFHDTVLIVMIMTKSFKFSDIFTSEYMLSLELLKKQQSFV